MSEMKRIAANSASDALMRALEKAEDIDQVMVIYREKESAPEDAIVKYRVVCTNETTIAEMNYLVDIAKDWLLRR